jgi:hypothetical protein
VDLDILVTRMQGRDYQINEDHIAEFLNTTQVQLWFSKYVNQGVPVDPTATSFELEAFADLYQTISFNNTLLFLISEFKINQRPKLEEPPPPPETRPPPSLISIKMFSNSTLKMSFNETMKLPP